jgi:predicted nuclease with TOPRIM domain
MDNLPSVVSEITLAIVAGVAGLVLGIQKLVKYWKVTAAESSVVDLMHTELERLGHQNRLLTEELNKLQIEIITLNSQLRNLSIENNKLHSQVVNLSSEVTRLQALLNRHKDFKENLNDITSQS